MISVGHMIAIFAVTAAIIQQLDAQTRTDKVLLLGNVAGSQTVQTDAAGQGRCEYSYNDRGRGDHITATWKLDAAGLPVEYHCTGNDYMKAPIEERFTLTNGSANWTNRSEQGQLATNEPAFYVPANAPPEFTGVLARALLKADDHKLHLLPAGEATIEEIGKTRLSGSDAELTQYSITGLDFKPQRIWLDPKGQTAAILSPWLSTISNQIEPMMAELQKAQQKADNGWSEWLAREVTRIPQVDLIIRNSRLFDPRDLSVRDGMSVLIRRNRVVRIAPDAEIKNSPDVETIDAHGRFLMPGLWDCHQHFGEIDGALDLANGITNARDMANNTDSFLERVARFDAGTELGPAVLKAGIIDGTGEFAGPTKMRVDKPEQANQDVDWYADHGYVQIKIYSSVKPELVPIIADRAHSRGLRVSGHVPAFMSARQFVDAGADEIQHLNFIELNFLFPEVQETRNRDRFIKVAEHAREFTPDEPVVRDFIAFLKQHHTVLDPTMNVFEALFCGDPTRTTPALEGTVVRFPPQVRRAQLSGALEVPKDKAAAYAEAFPAMLKLLKGLYDSGVTIVPGTDALAGYTLHHELELYGQAGIPSAEVLRLATLTPSLVMGVNKDYGVVAPGKIANMILVDGDPIKNLRDIDNVTTVIKNGNVYDPAAIESALGIASRK